MPGLSEIMPNYLLIKMRPIGLNWLILKSPGGILYVPAPCLDLEKACEEIALGFKNIKAVIYVTLNGRSEKYEKYVDFVNFCRRFNVKVVEDNAQSFGSCYHSSNVKISAVIGDVIGSFSFSMPKIITTGQGGCLVTNSDELALKLRKLKDFGRVKGGIDIHDVFGTNCKFTELQAIVGLSQINDIEDRVKRKKDIYFHYFSELSQIKDISFIEPYSFDWCPWFVDIYINDRDKLREYLKKNNIITRDIYPELTSQKINHKWFQKKSLRNSKQIADTGLWLPSSLDLKQEDIALICKVIKDYYA